ncbi:5-oxoprolinase subunit C family protein [Shewanella surugensis]|uniref:Biotin-dependent carboxyltransferase family protein n=1 Tax=Shewanella surugensis TaxID=212020 RepID=A0ABT0LHD7_9GAMM|nr:biotin-dependent carboxyltransferase family protein [Shewanella surugensis]MCL1127109.1 biotin-dependent carboxyltransferase family protein [Shewanella surugensis]
MHSLEIINPGPLSLIQDLGRFGATQHGLTQGGPIDLHAYCWGNYFLGNDMSCPQIEITLGQASFKAHNNLLCALTGAKLNAQIDGQPLSLWQSFILKKNQLLTLDYPTHGLRSYLAVKNGFKAPKIFNSVATVIRDNIGTFALKQGDMLSCSPFLDSIQAKSTAYQHLIPPRFLPQYTKKINLRVIESYQEKQFIAEDKHTLYHYPYQVSPFCDRMGCRLTGPVINSHQINLISEPIANGAIQIPPNGQPIILLNDRQTLGGYPKIGCIAKIDLPQLAQAKPDTEIHFIKGNLQKLQQEWLRFVRFFNLPF